MQVPREDAVIVGDAGEWTKRALCFFVQLVGISDLCKRADRYLCCQSEGLAYMLIAQLLERKLAERASLPCHLAEVVTRGVGRLKRASERIGLLRRGQ